MFDATRLTQAALKGLSAAQQRVCSRMGLRSCPALLPSCDDAWLRGALGLLAGFLALFLLSRVLRWYTAKRGGTLVAAAAAAANELRRANPKQYPPMSHSWHRISGRQLVKPLLCAVCFEHIQPDGEGKTVNTCEVCGEVAHEGCARHVPHDCKPVALDAPTMVHLWRPAGVAMSSQDEEVEGAVQVCHYCRRLCEPDMFSSEPIWSCAWCQAVAHVRCFQQFHPPPPKLDNREDQRRRKAEQQQRRGDNVQASKQNDGGTMADSRGTEAAEADMKADTAPAEAAAAAGPPADDAASSVSVGAEQQLSPPKLANGEHMADEGASTVEQSTADDSKEGVATIAAARTDSKMADAMGGLPPVSDGMSLQSRMLPPIRTISVPENSSADNSDGEVHMTPARLQKLVNGDQRDEPMTPQEKQSLSHLVSHPLHRIAASRQLGAGSRVSSLGRLMTALSAMVTDVAEGPGSEVDAAASPPARKLSPADLAALDHCELGAHRRSIVPPTAFKELPGVTWSARAKSLLPSRPGRNKHGLRRRGGQTGHTPTARPNHSWWGLGRETPWQNFTLGPLEPGLKPVLCFINTKSGPQIGKDLRRKFLRILNPLQVVELPREKPERALELFADMPGLRLLIIGGDGTVGWVLSCLDALQEARDKQEDAKPWLPPPIAVLPLGTGNDLARCLNWGGGMGAYQGQSVGDILGLLEQCAVTLLDRWSVRFTPQASQKAWLSKDGGSSDGGGVVGGLRSSLAGAASLPAPTTKAMNNYMGIGIDAKVALEFHQMRDQYPEWFNSRFGNKLWYTGVGAKEILGHTSLNLPRRLKVECDGRELALPRDTEGLIIMNIPSYMGGVDLWASGRPAPPAITAAGFTADGPQSMTDQRLELLSVQGSWHLGQVQVGLSQARRLCRCSRVRITLSEATPMQVDGEPWLQPAAQLEVDFRGTALMLRRLESAPLARMAAGVTEALEACQAKGLITPAQRHALTTELAARLHPIL